MCWWRYKLVSFFKIKISWNLYSLKLVQHTAWFVIESAGKCPLVLTVLALKGNSTSPKSIGWVLQGKLVSAVQSGFTHLLWSMRQIFLKEWRRSCPYQHIFRERRDSPSAILRNVGHFSFQRVKQRTAVQILVMAPQSVVISTHRGTKSLISGERSWQKFWFLKQNYIVIFNWGQGDRNTWNFC